MFTNQEIEQAAKEAAVTAFRPMASYDAENDCLEFFASNESCYAESIDALVTIYCSHDTGTPVGLRLKKVKKFFREFLTKSPGFRAEVQDHRIKVEHLFTAKIWALENPHDVWALTYRRFREVAQENKVEAEIGGLAELMA
jgi:hypothetical protein